MRTAVTIIIALLLVAALVMPALAHARLLSSDPADGASLPTLEQVALTFNEDINADFVQVTVTGPAGVVDLEAALVEGPVVTQPVTPSETGTYSLSYRVVSADGHPVSGAVTFTLTDVPAVAEPSATTTDPATASETATPTAPDAASASTGTGPATDAAVDPTPEDADTAGAPLLWLGGGAMLAGLAGAGVWLTRQRRHPEH